MFEFLSTTKGGSKFVHAGHRWTCKKHSHNCTALSTAKEISPGHLTCVSVTEHSHDVSLEAIVRAHVVSLARDLLDRAHNIVADCQPHTSCSACQFG